MIKSFRHEGLQELFIQGTSRKIHASLHRRALRGITPEMAARLPAVSKEPPPILR